MEPLSRRQVVRAAVKSIRRPLPTEDRAAVAVLVLGQIVLGVRAAKGIMGALSQPLLLLSLRPVAAVLAQ